CPAPARPARRAAHFAEEDDRRGPPWREERSRVLRLPVIRLSAHRTTMPQYFDPSNATALNPDMTSLSSPLIALGNHKNTTNVCRGGFHAHRPDPLARTKASSERTQIIRHVTEFFQDLRIAEV